jgi:hypothetical protein
MSKPILFTAVRALREIVVSQKTQTLGLRFIGDDNHEYMIDLPEALIGQLVVSLAGKSADLSHTGKMQPMTVDAIRPFSISDGRAGIELTIERTLRVPLLLSADQVDAMKKALDEASALSTVRKDHRHH